MFFLICSGRFSNICSNWHFSYSKRTWHVETSINKLKKYFVSTCGFRFWFSRIVLTFHCTVRINCSSDLIFCKFLARTIFENEIFFSSIEHHSYVYIYSFNSIKQHFSLNIKTCIHNIDLYQLQYSLMYYQAEITISSVFIHRGSVIFVDKNKVVLILKQL